MGASCSECYDSDGQDIKQVPTRHYNKQFDSGNDGALKEAESFLASALDIIPAIECAHFDEADQKKLQHACGQLDFQGEMIPTGKLKRVLQHGDGMKEITLKLSDVLFEYVFTRLCGLISAEAISPGDMPSELNGKHFLRRFGLALVKHGLYPPDVLRLNHEDIREKIVIASLRETFEEDRSDLIQTVNELTKMYDYVFEDDEDVSQNAEELRKALEVYSSQIPELGVRDVKKIELKKHNDRKKLLNSIVNRKLVPFLTENFDDIKKSHENGTFLYTNKAKKRKANWRDMQQEGAFHAPYINKKYYRVARTVEIKQLQKDYYAIMIAEQPNLSEKLEIPSVVLASIVQLFNVCKSYESALQDFPENKNGWKEITDRIKSVRFSDFNYSKHVSDIHELLSKHDVDKQSIGEFVMQFQCWVAQKRWDLYKDNVFKTRLKEYESINSLPKREAQWMFDQLDKDYTPEQLLQEMQDAFIEYMLSFKSQTSYFDSYFRGQSGQYWQNEIRSSVRFQSLDTLIKLYVQEVMSCAKNVIRYGTEYETARRRFEIPEDMPKLLKRHRDFDPLNETDLGRIASIAREMKELNLDVMEAVEMEKKGASQLDLGRATLIASNLSNIGMVYSDDLGEGAMGRLFSEYFNFVVQHSKLEPESRCTKKHFQDANDFLRVPKIKDREAYFKFGNIAKSHLFHESYEPNLFVEDTVDRLGFVAYAKKNYEQSENLRSLFEDLFDAVAVQDSEKDLCAAIETRMRSWRLEHENATSITPTTAKIKPISKWEKFQIVHDSRILSEERFESSGLYKNKTSRFDKMDFVEWGISNWPFKRWMELDAEMLESVPKEDFQPKKLESLFFNSAKKEIELKVPENKSWTQSRNLNCVCNNMHTPELWCVCAPISGQLFLNGVREGWRLWKSNDVNLRREIPFERKNILHNLLEQKTAYKLTFEVIPYEVYRRRIVPHALKIPERRRSNR